MLGFAVRTCAPAGGTTELPAASTSQAEHQRLAALPLSASGPSRLRGSAPGTRPPAAARGLQAPSPSTRGPPARSLAGPCDSSAPHGGLEAGRDRATRRRRRSPCHRCSTSASRMASQVSDPVHASVRRPARARAPWHRRAIDFRRTSRCALARRCRSMCRRLNQGMRAATLAPAATTMLRTRSPCGSRARRGRTSQRARRATSMLCTECWRRTRTRNAPRPPKAHVTGARRPPPGWLLRFRSRCGLRCGDG